MTSLEGAPKEVGMSFCCAGNVIYDFPFENGELSWGAIRFYEKFPTSRTNPIQEIYKLFQVWQHPDENAIEDYSVILPEETKQRFFQSLDHFYFKGDNKIDKRRFYRALEELGIDPPAKLSYYRWV